MRSSEMRVKSNEIAETIDVSYTLTLNERYEFKNLDAVIDFISDCILDLPDEQIESIHEAIDNRDTLDTIKEYIDDCANIELNRIDE